MASMRRNLAMFAALFLFAWFLPSMASPLFPLLSRSDVAATDSALDIAVPGNVSLANISMPDFTQNPVLTNEPALLPNSLTDGMYCEAVPSKCAEARGDDCMEEWFWDVHKPWVLESAKAFCEEVAKPLNGIEDMVGGHFHYFYKDEIVTKAYELEASNVRKFEIGIKDTAECKSNNKQRYPYTPVEGHDCYAIVYGAWHQCDNRGQGGAVEAGCIRFSIKPLRPSLLDLNFGWGDMPLARVVG
ncbi:MAG: hypothetical protein Q9195_000981 [Heterodermia aff. obscurata]